MGILRRLFRWRTSTTAPKHLPVLPDHLHLYHKIQFFSRAEARCHAFLLRHYADRFTILSKVRLTDIIDLPHKVGRSRTPEETRIARSLNQMHVDFLLVAKGHHQPHLVIEVDGRRRSAPT